MKYIKTYENIDILLKFKINDIVRIVGNNGHWKSEPFIIEDIKMQPKQPYLIRSLSDNSVWCWRGEEVLELVPDYELAAIKYNI